MSNDMNQWQHDLNRKVDRLLNDVTFIKNRLSHYLGHCEALTWLIDETPLFVNTDDEGCPLNFLNGGRYEEENFQVLASYRRCGDTFLDVGANLGVYSLRLAPMLRSGRIEAFEPIPHIRQLFARSAFLNGFHHVHIHPHAVSEHDGQARLNVPKGHAGGASLQADPGGTEGLPVSTRNLDRLLGEGFQCQLIKLDVEGHELQALRSMQGILARSPRAVVLFEKLASHSGIEHGLWHFLEPLGWGLYAIDGTQLRRIDAATFEASEGYFVAGHPPVVEEGGLDRRLLLIEPGDLHLVQGRLEPDGSATFPPGIPARSVALHGPYWYLPRGYYRFTLEADIRGAYVVEVAERFGHKVGQFDVNRHTRVVEFPVEKDLCQFEFVFRAVDGTSSMTLQHLRLHRIG